METKQNIANYLGKNANKYFKIPAYQRGYKWGVLKADKNCDASILVKDILKAMYSDKAEYFIQGVTVFENGSDVVLIDGQQRTTTLFLLLALLMETEELKKYVFFNSIFKLKYDIRAATQNYLKEYCLGNVIEPKSQDEFFIHQATQKMSAEFPVEADEREKLKKYILEKVKLFYVKVPEKHAARVFSMLNGAKAFMTTDELVKSAFLSEASKIESRELYSNNLQDTLENLKSQIGQEWQTTALRSRLARQWDKWMYWWNKEDVKVFYRSSNNPMGRLLEYYYNYTSEKKDRKEYTNKPEEVATIFKLFQNQYIPNKHTAIDNFEALRKLQKRFEDIYNDPEIYNYLGLTLELAIAKDYQKIIHFFIKNFKNKEKIKRFALLRLLGVSYSDIVEDSKESISERYYSVIDKIQQKDVYNDEDAKEIAFKILFMLNVKASIDRDVKFEFFYNKDKELFSFYGQRSLEHIWPKSKVAFKKEGEDNFYIEDEKNKEFVLETNQSDKLLYRNDFSDDTTEHCIGNLLFLHKNDNSVFNAKLPEDKKLEYFNLERQIYSRNLLHTMSAFAFKSWQKEKAIANIEELKESIKNKLEIIYNAYVN